MILWIGRSSTSFGFALVAPHTIYTNIKVEFRTSLVWRLASLFKLNVFILLSVLQEIPLKATSLEKPSYASVSSIQEEQQSKERVSRLRI